MLPTSRPARRRDGDVLRSAARSRSCSRAGVRAGAQPLMRNAPSAPAIAPATSAGPLLRTETEARAIGALLFASTTVPRISPGPAAGGAARATGARALGGKRAGGEKKAERGGEGGPHDGALLADCECRRDRWTARRSPPVSARTTGLPRGFRPRGEKNGLLRRRSARRVDDRARLRAAENPNRCTIVRIAGACAALLRSAPSVVSGVRRGVGRARVFRRPRGAYTLRASQTAASLLLRPMGPPPHPRAPSQWPLGGGRVALASGAPHVERGRSSARELAGQSHRLSELERGRRNPGSARADGVRVSESPGGRELS